MFSDGSCCAFRRSTGGQSLGARGNDIRGNGAVLDMNHAVSVFGNIGLVGDEDDGVAARVQFVEEAHDLVAGLGVEVTGGLVGEDDGGLS